MSSEPIPKIVTFMGEPMTVETPPEKLLEALQVAVDELYRLYALPRPLLGRRDA
jgi:hypothetical protein